MITRRDSANNIDANGVQDNLTDDRLSHTQYNASSVDPNEQEQEDKYKNKPNPTKAFLFAAICAILFGIGNEVNSMVSGKHGVRAAYPQSIGYICMWIIFHVFSYVSFRIKNGKNDSNGTGGTYRTHYFTKATSSYYQKVKKPTMSVELPRASDARKQTSGSPLISQAASEKQNQLTNQSKDRTGQHPEYAIKKRTLVIPLERCIVNGASQLLINITFRYAALSNANSGIIASIFSTSVAFTCLVFFFMYNQKLTKYDLFGILLIVVCVVMISVGQESGSSAGQIEAGNLTLAVIFAVLTGLSFTLNSLDLYICTQKVGFPINQLAYDGNLLLGLIFLPLFIEHQYNPKGNPLFTTQDILLANGNMCLVVASIIAFSYALQYGKAGTIQAISNCKTLVQTVLAIFIDHQIPSAMQFGGLGVGALGVTIIFVMKDKGGGSSD